MTRTFIIAEAGINHNGDLALAKQLVDIAAAAKTDAVKFQTFNAKKLASAQAPKASYQQSNTDTAESQLAMLEKLEMPRPWHLKLQKYARAKGVEFLSTAFDIDSLQFLSDIDLPTFKIPSGELTNAPLLWKFGQTGKPLLLSTGMATLSEVEQALAIIAHSLCSKTEPGSMKDIWQAWSIPDIRNRLRGQVTLLHCTSQYPTPWHNVNLCAMDTLAAAFGLEVGYSDHTEGTLIPIAAVARGARVIEKHFTICRDLPGPDHKASLEPAELKQMVSDIRALEQAFGDGRKAPQPEELDTLKAARQHIVAARPIPEGATLTREDLTTARCGSGLPPVELWALIGQSSHRAYLQGEAITP